MIDRQTYGRSTKTDQNSLLEHHQGLAIAWKNTFHRNTRQQLCYTYHSSGISLKSQYSFQTYTLPPPKQLSKCQLWGIWQCLKWPQILVLTNIWCFCLTKEEIIIDIFLAWRFYGWLYIGWYVIEIINKLVFIVKKSQRITALIFSYFLIIIFR